MRGLIVTAAVAALWLVPIGAAHAGCAPPALKESIDTGQVLIHYTTDPASPNAVSPADAQKLATDAQSAYTDEVTKLAMPGTVPDSDGKQDVYVGTTAGCVLDGPSGITVPRHRDQPTTDAYIIVKQKTITKKQVIAHELFHAMQMAVSRGGKRAIVEGTAEWAAQHLYPGQGYDRDFDPGVPLDCSDKICGLAPYDSWPFFEFLSERYGASIGFKIFQTQAALGNQATATQILDGVLGPLGSSAGGAYKEFSGAFAGDRLTHPDLRDTSSLSFEDSFTTGTKSRRLPAKRYQLEHLSSHYIDVAATDNSGPCKRGTLTLTIKARGAIAGTGILTLNRHARPIPIKGGVGRLTVRWPLCERTTASLALVNAAPAGLPQSFSVSGVVKKQG